MEKQKNYSFKNITIPKSGNRGNAIMIAIMVAMIMLSVAVGVSGILAKEITLTSIGTQSNKAFYIADMGAECAQFWDEQLRGKPASPYVPEPDVVFATSTNSSITLERIKCIDTDIIVKNVGPDTDEPVNWSLSRTPTSATTTFKLMYNPNDSAQPCALITVGKRVLNSQTEYGIFNPSNTSGLSGGTGSTKAFSLNVPAGAKNLVFKTDGGASQDPDADLYVRYNTPPTTSTNDCASENSNNNETCNMGANPSSGTWYVMIYGYAAYSGVNLTATYDVDSEIVTTKIISRGQSSCDINPRRVERTVEISYP